jgi:hypothetical protein
MKYTIFNTLTGLGGIGSMISYAMEAGVNMEFGPLIGIWAITGAVSVIGTLALASYDGAKQNRREKEYAEFLAKQYRAAYEEKKK